MGTVSLILIVINVVFSYRGLTNHLFFEAYSFEVDKVLINKDYKRLITSGFLHVSWVHLIFNMLSLYFFSGGIEFYLGGIKFLLVYFAALLGGNLLSLFIHRHHGSYSSVGASGAVCGVIFASIALFPGMHIGFFGIPIAIPAWFYGLAFVLYSIYGIRSKRDNIGHDAHLGGALIGMIVAILMQPSALSSNYFAILVIAIPCILFIYLIITRPQLLFIDNHFFKAQLANYTLDQRYNAQKADKQREIDRILDKIHKKGMESLTSKERQMLKEYSKTLK
jgi:membrane associated rhomboid family serine protease